MGLLPGDCPYNLSFQLWLKMFSRTRFVSGPGCYNMSSVCDSVLYICRPYLTVTHSNDLTSICSHLYGHSRPKCADNWFWLALPLQVSVIPSHVIGCGVSFLLGPALLAEESGTGAICCWMFTCSPMDSAGSARRESIQHTKLPEVIIIKLVTATDCLRHENESRS